MIDRHLRMDDMKWVYSEGVLTDVDGDSGRNKGHSYFYTLKGLSHEIDFKNFDQTLKNLT